MPTHLLKASHGVHITEPVPRTSEHLLHGVPIGECILIHAHSLLSCVCTVWAFFSRL